MKTPKSAPTDQASDIEVLSIKRQTNCGNLKAFVSIRLGGIEINGLRIVQQPGQRAFVQLPVVEYIRKDDGNRAFAPLVRIHDQTLDTTLRQAVLAAWWQSTEVNGQRARTPSSDMP